MSRLESSETMSGDEFLDYPKKEGLKERDCSKRMGMMIHTVATCVMFELLTILCMIQTMV